MGTKLIINIIFILQFNYIHILRTLKNASEFQTQLELFIGILRPKIIKFLQ